MPTPHFMCSAPDYFVSFTPPAGFWPSTSYEFDADGVKVNVDLKQLVDIPGLPNVDLLAEYVEGRKDRFDAYFTSYQKNFRVENHDEDTIVCGRRIRKFRIVARSRKEVFAMRGLFVQLGTAEQPWTLGFVYAEVAGSPAVDEALERAATTVHEQPDASLPHEGTARYWFGRAGIELPQSWSLDLIARCRIDLGKVRTGDYPDGYAGLIRVQGPRRIATLDAENRRADWHVEYETERDRTACVVERTLAVAGVHLEHAFAIEVAEIWFPPEIQDLGDGLQAYKDLRNRPGFVRYQAEVPLEHDHRVRVSVEAEQHIYDDLESWWPEIIRSLTARREDVQDVLLRT